tara:strand:+ start:15 stop:1619 length:1605 start_codon:yes stop_codon:yes gene_type:complete
MAMAPQMAQRMPNMPPPQMPPQGIEQAMPPQMMAEGGIVEMSPGGSMPGAGALYGMQKEYVDPLIERAKVLAEMGVASFEDALAQLQREAQINNPDYSMVGRGDLFPNMSELRQGLSDLGGQFQDAGQRGADAMRGAFDAIPKYSTDDPFQGVKDFAGKGFDALQGVKDFAGKGFDALRDGYGSLVDLDQRFTSAGNRAIDSFLGSFSNPYGRSDQKYAQPPMVQTEEEMASEAAYNDLIEAQMDAIDEGRPGPVIARDKNVQTRGEDMREDSESPVTIDGDSTEVADVSQSGIATTDPTNEAGGKEKAGGGKEVQSESVFNADDYRSRLDYLMSLGVDSDKEVEIPTLDYSDIRADLDRRTKSNMLFRLAEGIGKGDVASGIGGMSKVAEEAARDISKIDIAERKGQFDAATAAQKRQDDLLKTQRMLGAELMGLDAKLKVSSDTDRRELIRYYSGIRDGLQDQLVALTQFGYGQTLPKASQDLMNRIDKMLQNLSSQYGIVLPAEADGGADNNPAELGGSLDLNLPSRQTAP